MVSRQPQSKPDKSFFPQAVPARQPMADIYVRLRDLAVPRMGRNYVGVSRPTTAGNSVDEANPLLDDFARNNPAKRNEITKLRQMLSTAR